MFFLPSQWKVSYSSNRAVIHITIIQSKSTLHTPQHQHGLVTLYLLAFHVICAICITSCKIAYKRTTDTNICFISSSHKHLLNNSILSQHWNARTHDIFLSNEGMEYVYVIENDYHIIYHISASLALAVYRQPVQ